MAANKTSTVIKTKKTARPLVLQIGLVSLTLYTRLRPFIITSVIPDIAHKVPINPIVRMPPEEAWFIPIKVCFMALRALFGAIGLKKLMTLVITSYELNNPNIATREMINGEIVKIRLNAISEDRLVRSSFIICFTILTNVFRILFIKDSK
jgi:hypothetical protein